MKIRLVVMMFLSSCAFVMSAAHKQTTSPASSTECCNTLSPCCCCTCYCCTCWDTCCTALMLLRLGAQDCGNIARAGSVCLADIAKNPAHLNHLKVVRNVAQLQTGLTPAQIAADNASQKLRIDAVYDAAQSATRLSVSTTASATSANSSSSSPALSPQSTSSQPPVLDMTRA